MLRRLFLRSKRSKHAADREKLCLVLADHAIDLVIDIGANVGQTGLGLRQGGYRDRIISVEPVAACHEKLLKAAQGDPLWTVAERCALGDVEGTAEIVVAEATGLSSLSVPTAALTESLPKARTARRETVPLRRIDRILHDQILDAKRPFLKIDTQGHDLAALKGAEGVIDHLQGLQIEMSLLPLYDGECLYLDILNYVHAMGFRPYLLTERTFSRSLKRQLQIDGVFMREGAVSAHG